MDNHGTESNVGVWVLRSIGLRVVHLECTAFCCSDRFIGFLKSPRFISEKFFIVNFTQIQCVYSFARFSLVNLFNRTLR